MTMVVIIFAVILLIALLINAPGIGVVVFILVAMSAIQEGSHGKLPLADYFTEGVKLLINH